MALDEVDLIKRYFAPLSAPGAVSLTDDLAHVTGGPDLLITSDTIAENVHYLPSDPPSSIAQKLLRVNLSDLAAKGGTPLGYMLNATFSHHINESWIADFARGLEEDQERFDLKLLGGDTVTHDGPQVFSLTLLGQAPSIIPRRNAAQPGDAIAVSGKIGDAVLGLALLKGDLKDVLEPSLRDILVNRYRKPEPRLQLGQKLAAAGCVHAVMDISDGLIGDLGHILKESKCGAEIDITKIPLRANFEAWVERMLTGGDDYELLMTLPLNRLKEAKEIASSCQVPLTAIGQIIPGVELTLRDAKQLPIMIKKTGYRHVFK